MPLQLDAREYKLMLNHRWFQAPEAAVASLWTELRELAESLDFEAKGEFKPGDSRTIEFFDTADFSLHRAGFVLRQRIENDKAELTLKMMSPDPYIASGTEIAVSERHAFETKFEEDIGPPWCSRFSRSATVELASNEVLGHDTVTLADAAKFYPGLLQVTRDEASLNPGLRLYPVNTLQAYETVYEDAKLIFGGDRKSSVALILWATSKKGRPLVAELSFRIKQKEGEFAVRHCRQAMEFFRALQLMDWYLPQGMTKTQYAYRNRNAQAS